MLQVVSLQGQFAKTLQVSFCTFSDILLRIAVVFVQLGLR